MFSKQKVLVYTNMTATLPYIKSKIEEIKKFKYEQILVRSVYSTLALRKMFPNDVGVHAQLVWDALYLLTSGMDLKDLNNHRSYIIRITTWELSQVIYGVRNEMWKKVKYWRLLAMVNRINDNVAGIVTEYLHSLYVTDLLHILEIVIYRKMNFQVIKNITGSGMLTRVEEMFLEEFRLGYRSIIHVNSMDSPSLDLDVDMEDAHSQAPSLSEISEFKLDS